MKVLLTLSLSHIISYSLSLGIHCLRTVKQYKIIIILLRILFSRKYLKQKELVRG